MPKIFNTETTKSSNGNKIIDITVEEKPTGEIFAGAGTGTSGTTIGGGIKESNYLGKGIILDSDIAISEDEIKGKIKVINPNYKNTDKSLNTTIESTNSDYMSTTLVQFCIKHNIRCEQWASYGEFKIL